MGEFEKEIITMYQKQMTWIFNEYEGELKQKFMNKLAIEFVVEECADKIKQVIQKHLENNFEKN